MKRFLGALLALVFLVSSAASAVSAAPALPVSVPAPAVEQVDQLPADFDPASVRPMWFETAADIVSFTMSAAEFAADPNFWTGIQLVWDGAAVFVPGLPAVGAVKGGITAVKALLNSSAKLRRAVELGGVRKYWQLLIRWMPRGWQRHHIIEARFANRLGTTRWVMPAIPVDSAAHQLITNKMRAKIPYRPGGDYSEVPVRTILNKHIEGYNDLYNQTGDRFYEYLRDYVQEVLERVPSDID